MDDFISIMVRSLIARPLQVDIYAKTPYNTSEVMYLLIDRQYIFNMYL